MAEGFKKINEAAMKAVATGNYGEAAAIFTEGLALEEKLGLTKQIAESHANIGNVHFSAGEYDEALSHLIKAFDLFRKASNTVGAVSVSLTIAAVMEIKGDDAGAQKQLETALRMSRTGEQRGMAFYRIGGFNMRNGNHYKAQEAFNRAIMELERLNRQDDLLLCLLTRASLFTQMDRHTLAARDVARANSIARSNDRLMKKFSAAVSELGLDNLLS